MAKHYNIFDFLSSVKKSTMKLQSLFAIADKVTLGCFGFLFGIWIIRHLPKVEFGSFMLSESFRITLLGILDVAIGQSMIKYLAERKEETTSAIFYNSLIIKLILCAFFGIILICLSFFIGRLFGSLLLEELLSVIPFLMLVMIFHNHAKQYLVAHLQMHKVFLIDLSLLLLFVGSFLLLARFMGSAKDILYLLIGIYTVNSLHGWLYVFRNVKPSFRLSKRWLKKLVAFSKYSMVNNIGSNLYNQTNPVMIGVLIDEKAVALYGAAMIFLNGFYMLGEAFNMIVFPLTSHESTRSDFSIDYRIGRVIYEKYLKYMIIIFFPISVGLFLFPKTLLDIIYAGKYSTIESVLILRIVGFWGMIVPFVRLMGSIINGVNRPDILALTVILTTISNIFFNIILMRMWGVVGSAVSLVLSLAAMFGFLHVLSNKLLEIRYLEPFRQMKRDAISYSRNL